MWGEYLLKTTEYAPCSGVQLKVSSFMGSWVSGFFLGYRVSGF